jgi:hypothetical protein
MLYVKVFHQWNTLVRFCSPSIHQMTGVALRGFAIEPRDPAIPLPQLQIVTVYRWLGRFDSRIVVFAAKVNRFDEPAVLADDVDAIVLHYKTPVRRERSRTK